MTIIHAALGADISRCPRCGRKAYKGHKRWCPILASASPYATQQQQIYPQQPPYQPQPPMVPPGGPRQDAYTYPPQQPQQYPPSQQQYPQAPGPGGGNLRGLDASGIPIPNADSQAHTRPSLLSGTPRCSRCQRKSYQGHHIWCPLLYQHSGSGGSASGGGGSGGGTGSATGAARDVSEASRGMRGPGELGAERTRDAELEHPLQRGRSPLDAAEIVGPEPAQARYLHTIDARYNPTELARGSSAYSQSGKPQRSDAQSDVSDVSPPPGPPPAYTTRAGRESGYGGYGDNKKTVEREGEIGTGDGKMSSAAAAGAYSGGVAPPTGYDGR